MKFRKDNGRINIILPIIVIILIILIVLTIFLVNKNKTKNVVIDTDNQAEYEYFCLYDADGNVGIIDKEGNKILENKYSNIYIPNQSKDVFICYLDDENYHILNKAGEDIFTEYENVSPINFQDGSDMENEVLMYSENRKIWISRF